MKGGNLSQRVGGGGGEEGGRVSLRVRVEVFLIFFLDNMI